VITPNNEIDGAQETQDESLTQNLSKGTDAALQTLATAFKSSGQNRVVMFNDMVDSNVCIYLCSIIVVNRLLTYM
jgi:hypothetical protein